MTYTELQNSPELMLAVHFVGEADQVTQLFPQNILRGMGYPLDIQVILKVGLQWQRLCYTSGEARKTVFINSRRNSKIGREMFTLLVCLADQKSYRSYVCSHLAVRTSYAFIIPFFTEKVPLSYTFC